MEFMNRMDKRMRSLRIRFDCFHRHNAAQYALIASGLSIAIVGSVQAVGSDMMTMYCNKLLALF